MNAYTFIATADLHGADPTVVEREVRAALARHGAELIPCGWRPDADTIADVVDADSVSVVDMNPAWQPA